MLALTPEGLTMWNESWIQTFSGKKFHPLDPDPEQVCIRDIAHALALKCRWTGHCSTFYSIAEHSVRASLAVRGGTLARVHALLHDAGEAYLADVSRPVKAHISARLPSGITVPFAEVEERLMVVICRGLAVGPLDAESAEAVRLADDVLLATEARDLVHGTADWAWEPPAPLAEQIDPWSWQEAERRFLCRWDELSTETAARSG